MLVGIAADSTVVSKKQAAESWLVFNIFSDFAVDHVACSSIKNQLKWPTLPSCQLFKWLLAQTTASTEH